MTDNEIIELLNECDTTHIKIQCVESILSDTRNVIHLDLSKIVDILNRQKAEIERLQKENNQFAEIGKMYSEIKAEAVKEFDELLKEDCLAYPLEKDDLTMFVDVKSYNNLVKEMVGADGD